MASTATRGRGLSAASLALGILNFLGGIFGFALLAIGPVLGPVLCLTSLVGIVLGILAAAKAPTLGAVVGIVLNLIGMILGLVYLAMAGWAFPGWS